MKKVLSVLLALMMIISIIPMSTITASATSRSPDDAIAWCRSQLGKALDYDGVYGAQCVDFIAFYYQYLGVTTPGGNGVDYAYNALPNGWTRVQGGAPQKGDILVYSGNSANPYGHVAVYESDYSTYHQNVGGAIVKQFTNVRYNGFTNPYWGYIRPNWGSGGSAPSSYFTSVWVDNVGKTDATIHATINGTNLSTCGFYIGKSASSMDKRTETVNGYVENIWYIMSSDYGVLQPGTTYYYKFFITVGGIEHCSEVKTFKTLDEAYTISYNANGGSGAPSSQTKIHGTALTLSSVKPTRTGYTFLGWATSMTATRPTYSAGGTFTINANTTLYAVWHAHSYELTKTIPATCTTSGTKKYICSGCSDSYTLTTPALGHVEEIINAVSPTCTNSGLTEGIKCSVCNAVIKEQTVVSATGHNYQDVVTTPTCTTQGYTTYICACGETYVDNYVEATGHKVHDDGICENCGKIFGAEDNDQTEDCSCDCHKKGISNFFFKFALLFQRIFGANKNCGCGVAHY